MRELERVTMREESDGEVIGGLGRLGRAGGGE